MEYLNSFLVYETEILIMTRPRELHQAGMGHGAIWSTAGMLGMHCVIMAVHPSLTQVHDDAQVIRGGRQDVTSIQDQRITKIIVTIS